MPPEDEPTLLRFKADRRLDQWGKPDDVANAALFLASEMSKHIQGQVVNVDGGIFY